MQFSTGRKAFILVLVAVSFSSRIWPEPMLGLRPAMTVEPEYTKGVFDLNLAPLSAEFGKPGSTIGIRFDLVFTLRFGGTSHVPVNVGAYLGVPWYPFAGIDKGRSGFFVGPKVGLCRNLPGGFWATGPSVELGWSFDLKPIVLKACAEFGMTVFLQESKPPRWGNHGGLSCIVVYILT